MDHPDDRANPIQSGACVLAVIDIQERFLAKLAPREADCLTARAAWLIRVARALGVPVVAMAEDLAAGEPLVDAVAGALGPDTVAHDKDAFGLADNPAILDAVRHTGRTTAVCIGLETDVCVAQSALGLIARGYRVCVPRDVVATTAGDQETGLERMRAAGAVVTSAKALYYEWLGSVSACRRLEQTAPDLTPPEGLAL